MKYLLNTLIILSLCHFNLALASKKGAESKPGRTFFKGREHSKEVFTKKEHASLASMSQSLFGKVTTIEKVMESPKFAPFLKAVLSKGVNRLTESEGRAIYIMSRLVSGKEKESESFDALMNTMVNFGERPDVFLRQEKFEQVLVTLESMFKEREHNELDAREMGQIFEWAIKKVDGLKIEEIKRMCRK